MYANTPELIMLQRGRPKNNISRRCVDRVSLRPYPRLSPPRPSISFFVFRFALSPKTATCKRPSVLLRPVLNLIENSCLVELRRLCRVYRVSPLPPPPFLHVYLNQCHRPEGGREGEGGAGLRDGGKMRVKR